MKQMLKKFFNWLYYLDCKTEIEKQRKNKKDIGLAVWQLNNFTR